MFVGEDLSLLILSQLLQIGVSLVKEEADQEQKESSSSYFDTLNLSYAGNMDFSKAVVQVSIETSL